MECSCGGNCKCSDGECECESDEIEEIEFSLSDGEIEEWINELSRLKEEKQNVILEIDENTILKINYSDEEFEEEE